jgi:poly(3-hydroxybutyrate) depolymerase
MSGCRQKASTEPSIENIQCIRDNRFSCTFDGVKHNFIVDLPESSENSPLVIMLHGYGNSAESFRSSVDFEEKANAKGYTVVYAEGAPDPTDSSSSIGWNADETPESNRDTDFLAALAEYLQDEYSLDKSRTFAVGFSNGAFMTHTLAMRKSDIFSACVSVAGIMPKSVWESRSAGVKVGIFQITGEKDNVVPKNSDNTAKHSKVPAYEDVMAYWADANGAELTDRRTVGKDSELTVYENKETRKQIWDLTVRDGSHSWPVMQYSGFDADDMILEFLNTQ